MFTPVFLNGPQANGLASQTPGQPRVHTPEPNPDHNLGRILQNQAIKTGEAPTDIAYVDVVADFMLAYDAKSLEHPTGIRTVNSQGQIVEPYVHFWGRLNKGRNGQRVNLTDNQGFVRSLWVPACMSITLRGNEQVLQAAAELKRGQIVSFIGRLGIGSRDKRDRNGQKVYGPDGSVAKVPDLIFSAVNFYGARQGEIKVPLTQSIPQSLVAAPVQAPVSAASPYIPVEAAPAGMPSAEAPAAADASSAPF